LEVKKKFAADQLRNIDQKLKPARVNLEEIQTQMNRTRARNDVLMGQMEEKRRDLSGMESNIKAAEARAQDSRLELDNLIAKVKEERDRISDLEAQIALKRE
jgi:chromosome segregation ATPase